MCVCEYFQSFESVRVGLIAPVFHISSQSSGSSTGSATDAYDSSSKEELLMTSIFGFGLTHRTQTVAIRRVTTNRRRP